MTSTLALLRRDASTEYQERVLATVVVDDGRTLVTGTSDRSILDQVAAIARRPTLALTTERMRGSVRMLEVEDVPPADPGYPFALGEAIARELGVQVRFDPSP